MTADLGARLVASLRCGVVAVDHRGRVTALNGPAAELLGLEEGPSLGRAASEVFAGCPALARLLAGALERDTLPDRAEMELALEGGRRALIGYSLSRIRGEGGETEGAAVFFKDLTRVEEERERQALRNRLASLGEMAAQIAHEVRNRLGGIRLFVGLARRRAAGDPEALAYLDRAEAELLAANGTMSQVLDFVRPLRLSLATVDLVALCRASLDATLARFPEEGVDVRWEVFRDAVPVRADAAQLGDALANLFANALEAGATRLTVRLRTDAEGRPGAPPARLRLEIADDGAGMPPEVLRRIFHPFFTTKESGTGLGVPVAQKVLDAHGGSLDVRSEPGLGTIFTATLPCGPEEETHG